ncbi:MAG: VacJ family lipoprotein, partial [Gammaproteobacteria bacterium]|nr:VacJ family lipoprotein [Gammaproteobacteria bacterium]
MRADPCHGPEVETLLIMKLLTCALLIALGVIPAGCATPGPPVPHDPWEGFNRSMYKFNDTIDRAVLKPTAKAYKAVLPGFVRTGVTNVFNNLDDLLVAFNDLLQLKYLEAAQTGTRMLLNSTIGLYGLIDVARHVGLPKRNEDFGQTLGFYGVGPGPYLVLPFFGPSTVRDSTGLLVDLRIDPIISVRDNTTYVGALVLRVVNTRANLLSASSVAETAALDPYTFLREAYLQQRQNLIRDGRPAHGDEDELDDLEELEELDELDEVD